MNVTDIAKQLHGREYPFNLTDTERQAAKEVGIVVVYGASDDLMEFDGAIEDEIDCYNGGTAYLTRAGLIDNECNDDHCPCFTAAKAKAATIKAVWCKEPDGPAWSYETTIPHETFDIMEDGQVYCRGIVFALAYVEDNQ